MTCALESSVGRLAQLAGEPEGPGARPVAEGGPLTPPGGGEGKGPGGHWVKVKYCGKVSVGTLFNLMLKFSVQHLFRCPK